MTQTGKWLVVVGVCSLMSASSAQAIEPAPVQGRDHVDDMMARYQLNPVVDKLGRGPSNLLGGWLEVPLGIHERYSTSDTAGGMLTGAVIGLCKGIVRTGVGAYETVTFFLPIPEDFAPILPTLPYFQKDAKRAPYLLE